MMSQPCNKTLPKLTDNKCVLLKQYQGFLNANIFMLNILVLTTLLDFHQQQNIKLLQNLLSWKLLLLLNVFHNILIQQKKTTKIKIEPFQASTQIFKRNTVNNVNEIFSEYIESYILCFYCIHLKILVKSLSCPSLTLYVKLLIDICYYKLHSACISTTNRLIFTN